jgi:hypothetical protein
VRRLCLYSSVISRGIHTDLARGASAGGPRTAPSVRPSRGGWPRTTPSVRPSPSRGEPRTAWTDTEPSISKGGKLRARNCQLLWPFRSDFHENRKGSFTCRKYTTRTHSFTSLPKEGMLRIFTPGKNPTAWAGFEPATRGQHANH